MSAQTTNEDRGDTAMANPAQIATQVRFALSQIPAQNAHHTFEQICRQLTRQFICSNVLPATGPVSAGGDQGRDFETFSTYLRGELGAHGAFLGLVNEGTIAFLCTTQADGIGAKLRSDVELVVASGHSVHEIRAFCLASLPVGQRHAIEVDILDRFQVHMEIMDGEAIAELLARPDGFWIAEQFLALPAEVRPETREDTSNLREWYVELREKWRAKAAPETTVGELIDLRSGLREATFNTSARPDLPFWLGIMRDLLAMEKISSDIRQRARYELVVATLRGLGDLRPVDGVARAFLDAALTEREPARLDDAATLLMYVNGAAQRALTTITLEEITEWNAGLQTRVGNVMDPASPNRRASLLFTLGNLGLQPSLAVISISKEPEEYPDVADWDEVPSIELPDGRALTDDLFTNLGLTISAWMELAEGLQRTPLFPVDRLATSLQILAPVLIDHPGWRSLVDRVDEAVARVSGRGAVAARARDRALALLRAGRRLDALHELHQAKIDWWSGDTMRGALLAMLMIARIYIELRLPLAAKAMGLSVAGAAMSSGNDDLADLVPAGLLMAAQGDFASGAWCGATELFEIGLLAQFNLVEDGLDLEKHEAVQQAAVQLTYITACARDSDPRLASMVDEVIARLGMEEIVNGVLDSDASPTETAWSSFATDSLTAPPFSDVGETRIIRFAALGTTWIVNSQDDIELVRAAERFSAAAQAMLAELVQEDLCLLPVRITVDVEFDDSAFVGSTSPVVALPSNDGRLWKVRLMRAPERADEDDIEELRIELASAVTYILLESSLLPRDDFMAAMERCFRRGLTHKLAPARPYDELATVISEERYQGTGRNRLTSPWTHDPDSYGAHPDLQWQVGPGPTFSRSAADEMLARRYHVFGTSLRRTVPALRGARSFRTVVTELRARGWLDWHLLTATANIVLNYRNEFTYGDLTKLGAQEAAFKAAFGPEDDAAPLVPPDAFTVDAMQQARWAAMLSLLRNWSLESHQRTPDFPAIEHLLAARYGYWSDDAPHDDPFPE